MTKRYVDVYKDAKVPDEYQIGVRDDGAATVWGAKRELADWQRSADVLHWCAAGSEVAQRWRKYCGDLIGRVEYDDGEPEQCAPSP